jgi:hypothetical protein
MTEIHRSDLIHEYTDVYIYNDAGVIRAVRKDEAVIVSSKDSILVV